MSRFEQRRRKLVRLTRKMDLDALLVTDFTNVTYLSGFTGDDSYMLVGKSLEILLSDPRYSEQLGEECPGLAAGDSSPTGDIVSLTADVVRKAKADPHWCGGQFDEPDVVDHIAAALPKATLVPTDRVWWSSCAKSRTRTRVREIRQAIKLAERVFNDAPCGASARPDRTPRSLTNWSIKSAAGWWLAALSRQLWRWARELPCRMRCRLINALRPIRLLLIDWGAKAHLYMSDLTRILVTGKISPKLERIYGVVLKAQEQAIAAIRPGALMSEVDAAARNVIADAGFGKQFGHGLGHGFGLEIHETTRSGGQPEPAPQGRDGDHGRAWYLPTRLGWCANRGRHFGYAYRPRGAERIAEGIGAVRGWLIRPEVSHPGIWFPGIWLTAGFTGSAAVAEAWGTAGEKWFVLLMGMAKLSLMSNAWFGTARSGRFFACLRASRTLVSAQLRSLALVVGSLPKQTKLNRAGQLRKSEAIDVGR